MALDDYITARDFHMQLNLGTHFTVDALKELFACKSVEQTYEIDFEKNERHFKYSSGQAVQALVDRCNDYLMSGRHTYKANTVLELLKNNCLCNHSEKAARGFTVNQIQRAIFFLDSPKRIRELLNAHGAIPKTDYAACTIYSGKDAAAALASRPKAMPNHEAMRAYKVGLACLDPSNAQQGSLVGRIASAISKGATIELSLAGEYLFNRLNSHNSSSLLRLLAERLELLKHDKHRFSPYSVVETSLQPWLTTTVERYTQHLNKPRESCPAFAEHTGHGF